jgi:hypothetical protein
VCEGIEGYFKNDNDGHWYFVPTDEADVFERVLEMAYGSDNFDDFEKRFGKHRSVSPCQCKVVKLY